MPRFNAHEIADATATKDTRYTITLKDGRIYKLRKSDMDKEEIDEVVKFFLQ